MKIFKNFLRLFTHHTSVRRKIILSSGYVGVVVPMTLIALLIALYYYLDIEELFSEKMSESIKETVNIAKLYLEEHNNNIKISALLATKEVLRELPLAMHDQKAFNKFLDKTAISLGLSDIIIFNLQKGVVLGRTSLSYSLLLDVFPQNIFDEVNSGKIYVRTSSDKVQALLNLDFFGNTLFFDNVYLLVGRYVDHNIIQHLHQTQNSADIFMKVSQETNQIRQKVLTILILLLTLLLVISLFIATKLADFILGPLDKLSQALSKMRLGNNMVKLTIKDGNDEIIKLSKTFNRMVDTIHSQHHDIIHAKIEIEERKNFIETVLSELSSGIIVVHDYKIKTYNNTILKIFNIKESNIVGWNIRSLVPELHHIIEELNQELEDKMYTKNINFEQDNKTIHFLIKLQSICSANSKDIIITIDDITAVASAQRFKAWADIARRLAHEVKNPLTPIKLAVERLQYKFTQQIHHDQKLFIKYIETIIARVDDIQKMITDFADFAKASVSNLKTYDLCVIIQDVLFLQQHQFSNILYKFENLNNPCYVLCDKMQITQVLINLLKNAQESITARISSANDRITGMIEISLKYSKEYVKVIIHDNGVGISNEIIDVLCEPYVTTKMTGTGLGLSIVKKIIEEHKGEFSIYNVPNGAIASFTLFITNT
jgi:two-component system nitrogen regulation sensor histidine kinase NtrY